MIGGRALPKWKYTNSRFRRRKWRTLFNWTLERNKVPRVERDLLLFNFDSKAVK